MAGNKAAKAIEEIEGLSRVPLYKAEDEFLLCFIVRKEIGRFARFLRRHPEYGVIQFKDSDTIHLRCNAEQLRSLKRAYEKSDKGPLYLPCRVIGDRPGWATCYCSESTSYGSK